MHALIHTVTNPYTVKNSTRDGDHHSGWLVCCSRTLIRYKEHSSVWYLQHKSPEFTWMKKTYRNTTRLCWNFWFFWCRVTAWWKTLFQSHIAEQHKSYRMVVESWESVQVNQTVPLFTPGIYCEPLWIACTKMFTAELMDIFGLWDLNEKEVQELFYLLVFVWSPRSEIWLR